MASPRLVLLNSPNLWGTYRRPANLDALSRNGHQGESPFWCKNTGGTISIPITDQQIVDKEIRALYTCYGRGVLGYIWNPRTIPRDALFVGERTDSGESYQPSNCYDGSNSPYFNYLTSPYKHLMQHCFFHIGFHNVTWSKQIAVWLACFQDSQYIKVTVGTSNRPVLFIYLPCDSPTGFAAGSGGLVAEFGSVGAAATAVQAFRDAVTGAGVGLGSPYLVGLTNDIRTNGYLNMHEIGLDACGMYSADTIGKPQTFAAFRTRQESAWDTQLGFVGGVVPGASGGIRFKATADQGGFSPGEHPPGFGEAADPDPNYTGVPSTPDYWAAHLAAAHTWGQLAHGNVLISQAHGLSTYYALGEPTEANIHAEPLLGVHGAYPQAYAKAMHFQKDHPRNYRARGIVLDSR